VAATGEANQPSVAEMVARLEQRLREQPDDVRGWLMLGRSYAIMNRNEDARAALAQALERAPEDSEVMMSYAEVLTTINEGSMEGEPIALVDRVLAVEPGNIRALWMAGVHALNQGIPSQALASWQKILDSGKLDVTASAQVTQAMDSLRSAVAQAQGSGSGNRQDKPAGKAAVQVHVSLSPELRARVTGTETLFVFARASNGPPMPVAAQRLSAAQMPITVVLDDSNSMAPEMALSRFDTVVVTARISRAGTPRAAPGDLQGISAEIATRGAGPVQLVIDQQVE
jgi:cytochrome c-type biogenesis protein CcmH